ncbi:fungistatic metabolite [Stagonosporopsis vannaccii]|nr:fungistatic metabolite [Stagonosporopsis vannaccii]
MAISLLSKFSVCVALLSLPHLTLSLGKTDTITWGGDSSRAGYESTHNLDPQTVSSADFGNIWTAKLPGNFNGIGAEQVLSQPLVYTTSDEVLGHKKVHQLRDSDFDSSDLLRAGVQHVYIATTQNNLYKINSKTGEVVKSRNIGVPFMATDLGGCNDIYPAIGVTGTGVIDPATGLWYLTSKTYSEEYQSGNFGLNNAPGRQNGRYYFHAISTEDLSEAPNFPTAVHKTPFRNNKNRWLVAGDHHQRPALLQVGDYIYTGWASHCIQYNYTGAVLGFHKSTGAVAEAYSMQGGLEPNTIAGGGIWMSGGGLAYDGVSSMFFSTGNGWASQLPATGHPVAGPNVPTALEEAVVHMNLNSDGTISPVDFFMPWEKVQLDGADKDLGTTPFQLLPSEFSCPNARRVGVITGKSGKTYFLNADDLGGYQQGADRLDDAIFVYQHENSVYSAVGVMPAGKYIYVNVINYQTRVFQWSCNANGDGAITEVTTAVEKNAQAIGVGHGATTSLEGRDGTGLYWMTDVEGPKLRIYDATPPSDGGALKLLRAFNFGNPGKFARPGFGDGKAFIGTTGALYAFGSPVNLPLNCTGPINFAKTSVNATSEALPITCTANVGTTITAFNLTGNANFAIVKDSLPVLPFILTVGQQFSFQARFTPKAVGPLSSDVVVTTSNAAAGSSSSTPITLSGTSNSAAALFSIQPITVSFNSTVGAGEVQKSVFFNNNGDTTVVVTSVQFSIASETGPWIEAITTGDGRKQVAQFIFSNLPSTIPANTRQTVGISYNPLLAGNHAVFLRVSTNGGTKLLDVFGATGSTPSALFEFEKPDGSGWTEYSPGQNFTFGNVAPGTVRRLQIRITNNGSNTASPLGLTVSKPPFGVAGFVKAATSFDLAEGTQIAAGQSVNATVLCAPPERQANTPDTQAVAPWRINTNSDQGAVLLNFACNAAAPQVGPLLENGSAQHGYIGCYQDQTPGRQLSSMKYGDDNNTAGRCIDICSAGGYNFTGLSFRAECWCGNALPLKRGTAEDCNFRCTGDNNHTCGGDGVLHRWAMLDLFADSMKWDGVLQGPDLAITETTGDYQYAGCYAESGGKTFNTKSIISNLNTVDSCRKFCGGSELFGLQYGSECYCGSTIASTSTLVDRSQCGMTCSGNNSQYCGAGSRMQVYRLESTSSTSLLSSSSTSLSSASTTMNASTSSEVRSDTVSSTSIFTSLSNRTLITTSTATSATIPSLTSTFTPTLTSILTSTPTPETDIDRVSSRIGPFRYLGCYSEIIGRALTGKTQVGVTMTNRICATFCAGYSYFATEFSTECYCGNILSILSLPVLDGRCNMPCSANVTETCGGANGLTLFKLDTDSTSSTSTSSLSFFSSTTSPSISSSDFSSISAFSSSSESSSSSLTRSSASSASSTSIISSIASVNSTPSSSSSSSTSIFSSTSTTTSPSSPTTPISTPLKCPANDGSTYVSNSQVFLIECGKDYARNDMWRVIVAPGDFNACMNACATTTGCKSVALSGVACYLKSGVGPPNDNGVWGAGIWGARILDASSTSTSSSSSSSSFLSSSESLASTISSTSSSTPGTVSSQQLSTNSIVTSDSSSSTSSSFITTNRDSSVTSIGASTSTVSTSASTSPPTSSSVSSASSSATSENPSLSGSPSMSMSSSIPTWTSTSTGSSSSFFLDPLSSSTTPIPNFSPLSTASSTTISPTSTGPIVAQTAGVYYSLGCYGEPAGGRALHEVYSNSNMTVEMCASKARESEREYMGVEYGVECWMGDSFDTSLSAPLASSRCSSPCPGNTTSFCGGNSALQVYMLNSTLATPETEVPPNTALTCPANDDQSWKASNGAKFRIECGWDRDGGSSARVPVSSYEACLEVCAKTAGCGSVALWGSGCYIKTGTLGIRVRKDGIRGATLLKTS